VEYWPIIFFIFSLLFDFCACPSKILKQPYDFFLHIWSLFFWLLFILFEIIFKLDICFSISSSTIFIYQIWSSFFLLLFVLFKIIFKIGFFLWFHSLWFSFLSYFILIFLFLLLIWKFSYIYIFFDFIFQY